MVNETERLIATEQIKILKARYFRFMDTKQWDEMRKLFTVDAILHYPESLPPIPANEAIDAISKALCDGVVSIHEGYMPEIEISGPTTATGIWGMKDEIFSTSATSTLGVQQLIGKGHYHETYEKVADVWLIKTLRLTRLRVSTASFPRRVT